MSKLDVDNHSEIVSTARVDISHVAVHIDLRGNIFPSPHLRGGARILYRKHVPNKNYEVNNPVGGGANSSRFFHLGALPLLPRSYVPG